MTLTINGELKENIMATSLKGLLEELGIIPGRVAVEVNTQVIKKADYDGFRIKEGDIVEIVSFVGGG